MFSRVFSECVFVTFVTVLSGIAAELMQAEGTLLHHDQALFKEPLGGYT